MGAHDVTIVNSNERRLRMLLLVAFALGHVTNLTSTHAVDFRERNAYRTFSPQRRLPEASKSAASRLRLKPLSPLKKRRKPPPPGDSEYFL